MVVNDPGFGCSILADLEGGESGVGALLGFLDSGGPPMSGSRFAALREVSVESEYRARSVAI